MNCGKASADTGLESRPRGTSSGPESSPLSEKWLYLWPNMMNSGVVNLGQSFKLQRARWFRGTQSILLCQRVLVGNPWLRIVQRLNEALQTGPPVVAKYNLQYTSPQTANTSAVECHLF